MKLPTNDAAALAARWSEGVLLKRDVFSTVERGRFRGESGEVDAVLRRLDEVPWWSFGLAQHLFALGLGLPEDKFDEYFHKPMLMLRLLHYPPQAPDESGDHIGTRPHTDTGCFTILAQDQIGGLEILTKSGEWVFVPPLPGSYVVNIGEMMKAWTDGIFASTPHRVVNRYGAERYSVPFFVNPDYDAIFRPLIRNPDPVEAPKLHSTIDTDKDIKCGDWMVQLYSRIYPAPPPDVAAE